MGPVTKYAQAFRKLLVNIPPGFTKSRILSVMLPAWVWLRWPSFSVFALSTNPNVALRDADASRDVVKSAWYRSTFQPWWSFSGTVDAKGRYANTAGGWRLSKGWEAKVTGDRADLLILDDPNDAKEVWSEAERENVMEGWRGIRSRLNDVDYSIVLGVQQRLHPQDWSGQVLKDEAGEWEHLKIEQEKTEKNACTCSTCTRGHTLVVDPATQAYWRDTRAPGELAMESRFSRRYVEGEKRHTLTWAAQHQQNPLASEGNLFKAPWWRFWRYSHQENIPGYEKRTVVLPDGFDVEELSWDCSFAKTEGSSKVAGGAWGRAGPNKYLLDLVWKQMSFTEAKAALKAQVASRPRVGAKVIEDKANGPAIIDDLRVAVPGLVPFPVSKYGSKEARAAATSWQVEGGNVFVPLHAPWRDAYIAAHSAAPKGDGMDAVDQQSQILLRWAEGTTWDDDEGFDVRIGPGRRM